MQVPVLSGVFADERANYNDSYPVNMVPVIAQTGVSNGYLRVADGAERLGAGVGTPRGGFNWNGELYRVSGTKLVKIASDGSHVVLGDVGAGGRVTFACSFDRLAVSSGGRLYYWDGATLDQVVDSDLGTSLTVVWIDGYFMSTDGEYIVVTELGNPMSVNPLKYGSSEIDPDPIVAVLKLRNEAVAVNRYTLEFFNDVGGANFPFQRIEGAQVQKGALGANCACVYMDMVALLGSGHNEAPGLHLAANGTTTKISTHAIDSLLEKYTEAELTSAVLETHAFQASPQLWVRLPDRTLVYDATASQAVGSPVWFQFTSARDGFERYRVVDPVWCYDAWCVCDAEDGAFGRSTPDSARHFGDVVRWEFSAMAVYNEGRGALWRQLELVCLPGRVEEDDDPVVSTSYTLDGEAWSQDRPIRAGKRGDRMRRLVWFQQGFMRNWRVQRFTGDSRARIAVSRLEVQLEALV